MEKVDNSSLQKKINSLLENCKQQRGWSVMTYFANDLEGRIKYYFQY